MNLITALVHQPTNSSSNPTEHPEKKKASPVKTVALGALVATCELLSFGHILDRIKTHQQANPREFTAFKAAKYIYNNKGIRGFYAGAQWNVLTHAGKSGFRWVVMGHMDAGISRIILDDLHKKFPSLQPMLLGLSIATVEAVCLVCPAELIKTKEMTTHEANNFRFIPYMQKLGWKRVFDGVDIVVFRQAVSWCSFLIANQKIYTAAVEWNQNTELNIYQKFFVGAMAGAINVAITTPIDVVKTMVQKENPLEQRRLIPACREIYARYGYKGFYTSLGIRMVRSTWYAGITLTAMDRLGIYKARHG